MFANQNPQDVLRLSLAACGPGFALGEFFRLGESRIASGCGADLVLIHPALVVLMNAIRREVGAPVVSNSTYRTPAHNRAVKGAANSFHMRGMAADLRSAAATPMQIAAIAKRLGAGFVKLYPTFVHVDVR